ncbi:MAG: ketopantoate reductase family protein, partial [Planctomycetota bacterium]
MRVLIYGGGSVGLGVASCLLKAGVEIDIIARPDSVEQLQSRGLKRTGIFGDYYAPPDAFGCYCSMDEIKGGVYDFVLVCTKSFDSASAAADLSGHRDSFNDQTIIRSIIYNARVITGFRRPHKNEVIITVHADSIHIGSLFNASASRVENLCRLIQDGGIPCETTNSIEKDLWAKMLYNCALNPLGAILNVP